MAKGTVCKTVIYRFDSGRRLKTLKYARGIPLGVFL